MHLNALTGHCTRIVQFLGKTVDTCAHSAKEQSVPICTTWNRKVSVRYLAEDSTYTVKKVTDVPVPSRDVTNQIYLAWNI